MNRSEMAFKNSGVIYTHTRNVVSCKCNCMFYNK